MLTKVKKLEWLGGFRPGVHFNDGSRGTHDFTALVNRPGPMLEPLRYPDYFQRVFLEFGAPTWPNGFDIDPEWLRREMQKAGELSREAARRRIRSSCPASCRASTSLFENKTPGEAGIFVYRVRYAEVVA